MDTTPPNDPVQDIPISSTTPPGGGSTSPNRMTSHRSRWPSSTPSSTGPAPTPDTTAAATVSWVDPPASTNGEPPAQVPHYLEFHAARMWKGEIEFTSRNDNQSVATMLITQLFLDDALRVDWNGVTMAEFDRRAFYVWLRTGELGIGHNLPPFTDGQVTWSWKGSDLHVTITGVAHVFPRAALYELRMLAVR